MLLFSTILNIDKSLTKGDFLNLVIEWNQKSPHDDNVIPDLIWVLISAVRFLDNNHFRIFNFIIEMF